jgi:hypothetical protein
MMPKPQVLIRIALAFVLLAAISHTRADPDLWGHVSFGSDTLSAWAIPRTDSYSFTSDREWINHGWLGDSVIYLAFATGGGAGLVILKMSIVLITLAFVWSELKRQQVDPASRDLLLVLAVVGIFQQTDHVRPQIFSVLAFAFLIWILVRGGSVQRLLLIPLVFAAWVNLHGGWMVGGGVLAMWALLTLTTSVPKQEKGALFLAGALALMATLANPYGWGMWEFLWTTVGFGRAEITDWQPLYRLGSAYVALWVLLFLPAAAGALHSWRAHRREVRRLVVVAMLAMASLQVGRLLAFFAIAVVMLLGREIADALTTWRAAPAAAGRQERRLAAVLAIVVAAALIIGSGVVTASNVSCVRMDNDQPEPEIVSMVKQRQLQGRLVVWFDWGEYAMWYFAPALRVSIDGRRETVYSDEVMQKHLNFYYVPSSRGAFLEETRPDHIWLRADLPVVPRLLEDGWRPLFRGAQSIWLARDAASAPERVAVSGPTARELQLPIDVGTRCFPGP